MADFFVVASATEPLERFYLDVPGGLAADLARKLGVYRLRAKVRIEDHSQDLGVLAFAASAAPVEAIVSFADPRRPDLWGRAIAARSALEHLGDDAGRWAYREQRIKAGVPDGGLDFLYGDTFPHEANLDRLHGIDFRKGCYVGQEVVSRVQHRGTARKRVVPLAFDGEAPPVGSEITVDGLAVGTMGSAIDGLGLGLIRLDRVDRAEGGAQPLLAGGVPVRPAEPGWNRAPDSA